MEELQSCWGGSVARRTVQESVPAMPYKREVDQVMFSEITNLGTVVAQLGKQLKSKHGKILTGRTHKESQNSLDMKSKSRCARKGQQSMQPHDWFCLGEPVEQPCVGHWRFTGSKYPCRKWYIYIYISQCIGGMVLGPLPTPLSPLTLCCVPLCI